MRNFLIPTLAAATFAALPVAGHSAAFTVGNVVVYRVGDGTAALSSAATAVFLDEYTPSGTLVQTIPMPVAVSGLQRVLTASGTATSEGGMTLSADGRYFIVTGYDAVPGTLSVSGTAVATVNRIVGRVDMGGNVDTSTRINDFFGAGNIRTATSTDGTRMWAAGNNSGVVTTPFGNTGSSVQLNTALPVNNRFVGIFGNQLYGSAQSGTFCGLSTMGTGVPTASPQTPALLNGFPTATASPYAFSFRSPTRVYVADDRATGSGGGLQQWDLASGTWSLTSTYILNLTAGLRGANYAMDNFIPYAYTSDAAGSAQKIQVLNLNNTAAGFSTVATAGTNRVFRGVVFIADRTAPTTTTLVPAAGSTVKTLPSVSVTFGESVQGVVAGNLTVGGSAATAVTGSGVGPYVFSGFTAPANGSVAIALASGAIVDGGGNAYPGFAWNTTFDSTAPASSASVTDSTRVGTSIPVAFTASDVLSGVASTQLFVKVPGAGSYVSAGTTTALSGTFNYTAAAGNGTYDFYTVATDVATNVESVPGSPDASVALNTTANGAYAVTVPTGASSFSFPMTDSLDVMISLTGTTAGGTLTVTRITSPTFPAFFQVPAALLNESLDIAAGGGLAGYTASLTWQYDGANAPGAGIDRVFKFDGGASPTATYTVTPSGNTVTVPGITGFSTWYAGNATAVPVAVSAFIAE